MIGVCSGKVRSTPTPKLTLRTVKLRPMPEPWIADADALEDLDTGAVALDDLDVDLEGVAGAEIGNVVADARGGERVDDVGHAWSLPRQCHRSPT